LQASIRTIWDYFSLEAESRHSNMDLTKPVDILSVRWRRRDGRKGARVYRQRRQPLHGDLCARPRVSRSLIRNKSYVQNQLELTGCCLGSVNVYLPLAQIDQNSSLSWSTPHCARTVFTAGSAAVRPYAPAVYGRPYIHERWPLDAAYLIMLPSFPAGFQPINRCQG